MALTQARDRTEGIANVVFPKVLYSAAHPYGRTAAEASIKAITRDEVLAYYKAYFRPGRAIIAVAGDVTAAAVKAAIDHAFAAWRPGGEKVQFRYPALPQSHATTLYLVDKPGAAQSTFAIGNPGPARSVGKIKRSGPSRAAAHIRHYVNFGALAACAQHRLDMTHITERVGSPQTLVCTKDRRTFDRRMKEYKAEVGAMRSLLRMPPKIDSAVALCGRMKAAANPAAT